MALAAAALAALAGRGTAQAVRPLDLAGRVLHVRGADSTPVVGVMVVAHRVAERTGPIDSMRTGPGGRFRFHVASPERGGVYLVSTRFAGIGYFSPPFAADSGAPEPIALAVYDTATTGTALAVTMRHLVVAKPGADGNRSVLDIIEVQNPDARTRIGRDSTSAVWAMRLPRDIAAPQAGEGDIAPSSVRFERDSILVSAPLPPGGKEVVAMYLLPGGQRRLALPIDQPTARLEVLTDDSTAQPEGLAPAPPFVLEGRTFLRFVADSLARGAEPVVRFGGSGLAQSARRWSWLVVVLAALALAAGAALALGRRGAAAAVTAPADASGQGRDALLAQLVALDERYAGREGDTPQAEWRSYRARRARLKEELARHVARG
jgi:hypothetical protein